MQSTFDAYSTFCSAQIDYEDRLVAATQASQPAKHLMSGERRYGKVRQDFEDALVSASHALLIRSQRQMPSARAPSSTSTSTGRPTAEPSSQILSSHSKCLSEQWPCGRPPRPRLRLPSSRPKSSSEERRSQWWGSQTTRWTRTNWPRRMCGPSMLRRRTIRRRYWSERFERVLAAECSGADY